MGNFDVGKVLSASVGKVSVGDILTALIVLVVCLMAVRLLMKLARRLLSASKLDGRVQKYLLSGVRLVLYLLSAIIVMESLNVDMTSLVALLSVASLGVTLAAEDVLANVAGWSSSPPTPLPSGTISRPPVPPAPWKRSP